MPYNDFMNDVILTLSPTQTAITQGTKSQIILFLEAYRSEHMDEAEDLRIIEGVLSLHNEQTRDFLKYTDMEILTIVRQLYYYRSTLDNAIRWSKRYSKGKFILDNLQGNNRALTFTELNLRRINEELEVINTQLMGLHGTDLTDVRLENRKGNESHKLDLIEKKGMYEELVKVYQSQINHAKQVRKDIILWVNEHAPDEVRQAVNNADSFTAAELLEAYAEEIETFSNMNESDR